MNPNKKSNKFRGVESQWEMVDSLQGGTTTMRSAGERYLPRNPKESEKDYITRVNRTTLFNVYKRAIQHAVARAFSNDITVEGYPTELGAIFTQDVDAQNRDLTQFAKALFSDAMNRGASYMLVDFPRRLEQPLTLADAMASGDRPYWISIPARNVLAAYSEFQNGSERLTHFRFLEYALEVTPDGLDETTIEQVKAFTQASPNGPVVFTIYREVDGGWVVYDSGIVEGVPQIPVVCAYTNRTGFFIGTPPLLDLAETNIAHWQSSSEQRNILHVARVPFLHVSGLEPTLDGNGNDQEIELSIHSILKTGEKGNAKWVETTGTALTAGADDLADLEQKMEALGLMLTAPRSGNTTATENAINAAESNSLLKDYALSLGDALEQAMYLTGFYLGLGEVTGRVVIDTSFAVDLKTTSEPVDPSTPTQ